MKPVTPSGVGSQLRLEGVRNFRDLGGTPVGGGLHIRAGILYRGGHFGAATSEDWRALKIHRIRFIDLRHGWEAEIEDPGDPAAAVNRERMQRNDGGEGPDAAMWANIRSGHLHEVARALTPTDAEEAMIRLYAETIADDPAPYARFLASLAHGELPVVVHCSAGKDRTGWAVATLLAALGAPEKVIRDDYAQSSLPCNQYIIRTATGEIVPIDEFTRNLIQPLMEARQSYLDTAWTRVERSWGSRTSYLKHGLGLTPRILTELRTRLLG